MLIIYRMTCMEDRELFRALKGENKRRTDSDTAPIKHTQLEHYKQLRAWKKKPKQTLMNKEIS